MRTLRALWQDESGATAIEYGLIAALVAVAIIAVLGVLGERLQAMFNHITESLPGGSGGDSSTNDA